jgi:Phosphohistidine phosphatase SixA
MASKTLILMRHAKSSWQSTGPDFRRPLNERGVADATAAGRLLTGYHLDIALISEAVRAERTWAAAEAAGARCADVRYTEAIYHAWPNELLALINDLPEEATTAILVGHQPTLGELILGLAKPNELTARVQEKLPTCAMAVLTYRGAWKTLDEGKAQLKSFEIPRG